MTTLYSESLHNKHYEQGDSLYKKGRYREAIKEFETALKIIPNDPDTAWAIADCYSELNQPDLAEKFFKTALGNCPESKRENLIYNLGNALFDQMKYQDAIKLYESISKSSVICKKAKANINAAKRKIEKY